MSKKAKAVVYRELGKPVSVEEVEVLAPGPGEVMIKVAACGVCHSDLSATNGTIPAPVNTVLGHEGAGTVVEVGERVTGLAVGDPVAVSWIPMCGVCRFCLMGRPALCDRSAKLNHKLTDGTTRLRDSQGKELNHLLSSAVMASYATLDQTSVIKIEPGIPMESAALVGCAVTTGVGAVLNTAKVEPGSIVAVIGAGGVGLNAIQGAILAGARAVIAIDTSDEKLELAKAFGATHVINAAKEDVIDRVRKGAGAPDYAFDCVGVGATVQQAYSMVRKGGTAVVVGIGPSTEKVTLTAAHFPFTEKTLTGSMYGSTRPRVDFPKILTLYRAKRLKLDELVTQRYPIEDAQRAFDDMKKNARGVIVFE
ncbi:MAG TPA: Zn-dependent alcohol dehydrogenase [Polyangiaceae bacterium]|jgi:S-(hydroxymethyl)glutathione dehydrogenase/alcohol dehydrogenase|nr:Zn-dependent alcohol dehydrogenase [Polyangiaceae bacterium]